MKYLVYIILFNILGTGFALAADSTDGVSSAIAVEQIMCRPAMISTGSTGNAAYQPGVDVNGNPVPAADLSSMPQAMVNSTTYTEVPLNIDLAKKLNLSQPAEMLGNFGSIRIYNDGHVSYNGQDITQQANVICGRTGDDAIQPMQQEPRVINSMQSPDVALPGGAAPSSTTTAR